jgi:hypothetical protein
MRRTTLIILGACFCFAPASFAQSGGSADKESMIRSAMSAALPAIAENATIMEGEQCIT